MKKVYTISMLLVTLCALQVSLNTYACRSSWFYESQDEAIRQDKDTPIAVIFATLARQLPSDTEQLATSTSVYPRNGLGGCIMEEFVSSAMAEKSVKK